MIIVTGTKRSGTSMWMQILGAAGLTLLGEAFPKNWGETISEANPHGFYESPLRRGVFYATNPNPKNGHYLPPDTTQTLAVKVFIPGLCRTDLAYIRQVVGTMRHWREYAASIERLTKMEDEAIEERGGRPLGPPERLDPVLEWWLENFALIRDLVTRRYPAHVVTYENVVERPEEVLPPLLQWVGADDIEAGIAAVSPDTQTQDRERIERDHEFADHFDEIYGVIHSREPIDGSFLEKLNEVHQALIPRIEADQQRVMNDRLERRRKRGRRRRRKSALHPDMLEALVHGGPDEESEADDASSTGAGDQ